MNSNISSIFCMMDRANTILAYIQIHNEGWVSEKSLLSGQGYVSEMTGRSKLPRVFNNRLNVGYLTFFNYNICWPVQWFNIFVR